MREAREASQSGALGTANGACEEGHRCQTLDQLAEREEDVQTVGLRSGQREAVPSAQQGSAEHRDGARRKASLLEEPVLQSAEAEVGQHDHGCHLEDEVPNATQGAIQVVDVRRAGHQQTEAQNGRQGEEKHGLTRERGAVGLLAPASSRCQENASEHGLQRQKRVSGGQDGPLVVDTLPQARVFCQDGCRVVVVPSLRQAHPGVRGHRTQRHELREQAPQHAGEPSEGR
mmetsp:Transcript_5264/g.19812  ORF Transcript_5264/g.19812 Transcript_5264/m.19812 type:complete len:230 (+) Transcript_5264:896-1585(+)